MWVFGYNTVSEIKNEPSSFEIRKRSVEEGVRNRVYWTESQKEG